MLSELIMRVNHICIILLIKKHNSNIVSSQVRPQEFLQSWIVNIAT